MPYSMQCQLRPCMWGRIYKQLLVAQEELDNSASFSLDRNLISSQDLLKLSTAHPRGSYRDFGPDEPRPFARLVRIPWIPESQ